MKEENQHSITKRFLVACLYIAISGSTTFFNKAVLSHYKFNYPLTILFWQMILTLFGLHFFKALKIVTFEDFNLKDTYRLLSVSLIYSLNVGVALSALEGLNVPLYGALKRLNLLVVLIGEKLILNKNASTSIVLSVGTIVFGAFVAAKGDLDFDPYTYLLIGISCLTQSAFLLLLKKTHLSESISELALLNYNSSLSLPFIFLLALYTGEFSKSLEYTGWNNVEFLFCFIGSLILGFSLNYSMFLCTTVNSPLDLNVAGQFKAILQTIVGLFVLGGIKLTTLNIIGLSINSIGGIWYTITKWNESENKTPKESSPTKKANV